MAKKLVSLLLALSMTATLFAGCGAKEETKESAATDETTEAADEEAGEEAEELEPVVLKWWTTVGENSDGEDRIEAAINEYLAEVLPNTTVELSYFTTDEHKEKFDKALASGETIDISWFGYSFSSAQDYVDMGAMTELDDLMAEYGQGVVETLGENVIDMHRAEDGNAYFLPVWQGLGDGRFAVFVPEKYIEVVGEDWATEFQAALDASHAADFSDDTVLAVNALIEELVAKLDEAGVAHGGINIRNTPAQYLYGGEYSNQNGNNIARVSFVDDTYYVEGAYMENGFNYKVNDMIAGWYEKGLIREDAASYDWNSVNLESWGNLPENELFCLGFNDAFSDNAAEVYSANTGIDFRGFYITPDLKLNNGFATGMIIPSTSENPERAMMLLNLIYSDPTIYKLLCYGIEGTDYTVDDQGIVNVAEGTDYYGVSTWRVGTCEFALPSSEGEIGYYAEMKEKEATAEVKGLVGFTFVHTDETTLASSNIDAAVAQYKGYANAIRPVEEFWADYRQAALDNGYEDYFNEYVSQLIAFAESKGRTVEVVGY